jgi:hypothetical protein
MVQQVGSRAKEGVRQNFLMSRLSKYERPVV